ncbi:hypothetical protein [Lachnoclostridium phytofermentans]|uniref:Uncharacterized protein n=1 Tax=Lachnoclostridium phytofermentans (strain ATCC 700394 / DSM 18823 / ISDg) TaxID=357809 RepID=A9KKL6_LACP7|nr:hypothetical protein [Lachnoclostridium phytofermentans]ABX41187.1 hypothetical protein Cphy_0800 [Lachnoclostridium phytofermentans ISDg]
MYGELYESLSRKELIRYYPCSREEYFSIPVYLKSYCDEQSNVYSRFKEMEEHQLVVLALQLEQLELNEDILKETSSAARIF